jgi:hypothetical protein
MVEVLGTSFVGLGYLIPNNKLGRQMIEQNTMKRFNIIPPSILSCTSMKANFFTMVCSHVHLFKRGTGKAIISLGSKKVSTSA